MLKRLVITRLFGTRNVKIDFHKDLTLLIGRNGSGKTTILNLISALGTGNPAALFRHDFAELSLFYNNDGRDGSIKVQKDAAGKLHINANGETTVVDTPPNVMFYVDSEGSHSERPRRILEKVSSEIQLLYLPLSREIESLTDSAQGIKTRENDSIRNQYIIYRSLPVELSEPRPVSGIDGTIAHVNEMVKEKHRKTMLDFERMNQEMRKQMFQAAFRYNESPDKEVFRKLDRLDDGKIKDLKVAFQEMGLLTEEFAKAIDEFFSKLHKANKSLQDKKNDSRKMMSLFMNAALADRIVEWVDIAQTTSNRKCEANRPLETFLEVTNNFLNETDKQLLFSDAKGILSFRLRGKEFPLEKLSSGEKQVVIFFAYLMFGIAHENKSTYLIDEPELSLHLTWQHVFCESVLKVSPNLQLVFATHSPEIVGPFYEKCVDVGGEQHEH